MAILISMKSVLFFGLYLIQYLNFANGIKNRDVTCGSVIKLLNTDYNVRLHSHDVKYGSGSGQQSVTGTESQEDVNSHWVIKAVTGKTCERGESIKCGDRIRFEHLATKKNLHSHHFSSPLSSNQEISAYGANGLGDSGDDWEVVCFRENLDPWTRDDEVHFQHVDTLAYLGLSGRSFGRPISGQLEVVGLSNLQQGVSWKVAEGLFIMPRVQSHHNRIIDEL